MDASELLDVWALTEDTALLESDDVDEDNCLYDKVFKYQPLLSHILSYVHGPPSPSKLLPLRLVSSHFKEAVFDLKGRVEDRKPIQLRLSKEMELELGQVSELDGRLARDVYFDKTCFSHTHDSPLFSSLVQSHGSHMQILRMERVAGRYLGNVLTLVNEQCPALRRLHLYIDPVGRGYGHTDEWKGCFQHLQSNLEALKFSTPFVLRERLGWEPVANVMKSFVEVTPNLKELTINGDMGFLVSKETLRGLKYLKHTSHRSNKESLRGIVSMLIAGALSLESLEFFHRQQPPTRFTRSIRAEIVSLKEGLPALKNLTFEIRKDVKLSKVIWWRILMGRTGVLETLNVSCHEQTTAYRFWRWLLSKPVRPLVSLKTLTMEGSLLHSSSQTERLEALRHAFPNLSRIAYPIERTPGHLGGSASLLEEVLQCMSGWPLKEVQLSILSRCSIHAVISAFEVLGEGYFASGLESLSVVGPGWAKNVQIVAQEQFERLTRILLWTRPMKKMAFHAFRFSDFMTGRLDGFISSHGLPVVFSPDQAIPVFEP